MAETIRLAAEAGLVGCSIEDASGNSDAPIFELGHARERIAAAAAARALPFPVTRLVGMSSGSRKASRPRDSRERTVLTSRMGFALLLGNAIEGLLILSG